MSRESFDERQYRLELLDAYGSLLTQKQQEIYEFIYGDDLSLSELAENLQISKAAISDLVKRTTNTLEDYEEKLHYVKKQKAMREFILKYQDNEEYSKIIKELSKINEE